MVSLLALASFATSALADEALDDLSGRVEYAFYAADARELQSSVDLLNKLQVTAADRDRRDIYLNYGRWKLAQLLAQQDASEAQRMADGCVDAPVSAKPGDMQAQQYALRAACLGALEQLRPLRSAFYFSARDNALNKARLASKKSPEVLFVAAWLAARKGPLERHFLAFKQAVDAYAASEGKVEAATTHWGYAEACTWLGRAELARGNGLAARNLLEQALVLAPDYHDAQQALRSLNIK